MHRLVLGLTLSLAGLVAIASVTGEVLHAEHTRGLTGTRATPSEGLLRLGIPDVSPTIDPALVADEQNVELAGLLYSGLVRFDSSFRVVAGAAARWSVSADHRSYVFHLHKGLRFSNGDPLTARDFAFSIARSLSPLLRSPSAATYLLDIQGAPDVLAGKTKKVRGIRVIDSWTIEIRTRWPVSYFLTELAYPTSYALDAKRLRRLGAPDNASWYSHPISSGPYRLKSWDGGSSMVLLRNGYFTLSRIANKVVKVSFNSLSPNAVYRSVSHSLDVAPLCASTKAIRGRQGVREIEALSVQGIYMSYRKKALRSRGTRLALQLALSRSDLVRRTLGAAATPYAGFVPPGESGGGVRLRIPSYNPSAAKTLLRSSGYGKGKKFPPMTLYYADDPCSVSVGKLARAIARSWHTNLGLPISTQALTVNTLLTKAQNESLSLFLFGPTADYPDPHDSLSLQWQASALGNGVRYHNAQFDATTRRADVTWRYGERTKLVARAQQILADDAAWIPLYVPHRFAFLRPQLENLTLTGYGLIPTHGNWAEVWLRPAENRPTHAR